VVYVGGRRRVRVGIYKCRNPAGRLCDEISIWHMQLRGLLGDLDQYFSSTQGREQNNGGE
jgi:hypothetical protein